MSCSVGVDYNLPETSVTLTPGTLEYSVSVEIVNDGVPEPISESLLVTFSVVEETVVFNPNAFVTIAIEDNDSKEECCLLDAILKRIAQGPLATHPNYRQS